MEKIIFIFTFVFTFTWIHSVHQEQDLALGSFALARSRMITLSNALPVQFWLEEEETFNEKSVCGIEQVCWCLPWHCEDEIKIQFTDSENVDYALRIINSQSVETDITVDSDGSEILYPIDTWDEFGSETSWADVGTESPSVAVLTGDQSNSLRGYPIISPIPAGETVLISCKFIVTGSDLDVVFRFRLGGSGITPLFVSIPCSVGTTEVSFEYTGDSDWDDLLIEVFNTSGSTGTLTVDYIRGYSNSVGAEILYSASFIPQELGICDDQIILQIIDTSTSPPTVVAKSDCIQVKELIACTLAIDYSNHKDFNNLIFEDLSPSPTFRIRIPAKFFMEDNPAEQEDTELSNGEIVRLYNKLEERRKLEIGFVPHYIHRKIQMILMCDNVTIDRKNWIRRDTYQKTEGNRTYPLKRGEVWLHDKDFIRENQL